LTNSIRISWRLAIVALMTLAIAACAGQKRAKRPAPAERPVAGNAGPPPQVSACREYADSMAGRQLQQDYDSIQGNFQGGSSQVFRDFAHLDAQHYYQQLYESCLSQHRAGDSGAVSR
jgi:hypothetical protein